MAKLVRMLNIQNLIILIVLLATTLVNSLLTRQPPAREPLITAEEIETFVAHLEHFRHRTRGKMNGTSQFNSWSHWNATSHAFKCNCAFFYQNKLIEAGLNQHSDINLLGQLAYRALDTLIKEVVTGDLGLLTNYPALKEELEAILNKGEFLEFAVYWDDHKDAMECMIDQRREENPHINVEQAELITILQGYLTRNPKSGKVTGNSDGASSSKSKRR